MTTLTEDFLATIQRTSLPEQPTMLAVDRKGGHHVVALAGGDARSSRRMAREFIRTQKIQEYTIAAQASIGGTDRLVFQSEKRGEVGRVQYIYLLPEYLLLGREIIAGSLFT